jgi:hypothetical protein
MTFESSTASDPLALLDFPQLLDGKLRLRWGTPADAEALAAFNIRIHSDEPGQPENWLGDWTRDLLSGRHPTTTASDFTVVEDISNGTIVSTLVLIPQVWTYAGTPLGVGRIELVGTDAAYRRRGLVRRQMDAIHALSAARGHHLQAITGIPWYYRQFGYEMAVNLGGGREFFWNRSGNEQVVSPETYEMRPATTADIPLLEELYAAHSAHSLLVLPRDDAMWRWELEEAGRETDAARHAHIISTADGRPVAYVEYRHWGAAFGVRELGVLPGHSWREVVLYVTRELKRRAEAQSAEGKNPVTHIRFVLGERHPVYTALGDQLEQPRRPYAWYIRVADVPGLIRQIASVLETRLAESVMAGHSGLLRLNFYTDTLQLTFANGRLAEVGRFTPDYMEDGDALFPDLTFLQLLFGHRSLEQLDAAHPDCYANNPGARILLDALFPYMPSNVSAAN